MMSDFNRVFLDTAPLIYFFDEDSPLCADTTGLFTHILQHQGNLLTSVITCAEYLVHPYRNENISAVNAFWQFLAESDIYICDIDRNIADKAARIRAEYRSIKAFDSLQLACACCTNCDFFLTNDKQLRQFSELRCITVEDWAYEVQ